MKDGQLCFQITTNSFLNKKNFIGYVVRSEVLEEKMFEKRIKLIDREMRYGLESGLDKEWNLKRMFNEQVDFQLADKIMLELMERQELVLKEAVEYINREIQSAFEKIAIEIQKHRK